MSGLSLGRLTPSIFAALVVLLVSIPAWAGPPTDFVKSRSDRLFNIINQPVGSERTKLLKDEIRSLVAYDELAGRALGEHWTQRTDAERKQFIQLLEDLVELNYANRFKQSGKDLVYKVRYTDEKVRASSGQAIVKTEVDYGGEVTPLDYKLVARPGAEPTTGEFIIYDVVFDDISLEETYRDSYVPIITKQGWGELINRMKARLDELKRQ